MSTIKENRGVVVNVSDRRGFTLVELAVSMVVIGILLGLGMSMVGPLMTTIKVRESKENLGAAVESINSWASGNNRLPPLAPVLPDTAKFSDVVKITTDAWGKALVYVYDSNIAPTGPTPITKDTICGRRSTAIRLIDSNNSTIQNVAYVVLSKGDDRITDSKDNATNTEIGPGPFSGTIKADMEEDLVRWVTIDELRTKIGCQGAQLKILNNELPPGNVGSLYRVNIYADGGVPFSTGPNTYKWCVSTLPAGFSAPVGGIQNANCLDVNEATWGAVAASSTLTISFVANAAGLTSDAHQITVVVRDNADNVTSSAACSNASPGDNCASKVFVLTINPS